MTKSIKLDNEKNYLIDRNTGSLIKRFDKDNKDIQLVIQLDDSTLVVDNENINVEYGDQVVVRYNDDLFIIDDGYQPTLIKAGYIVYKNYDEEKILDREKGMDRLNEIMSLAHNKVISTMDERDDDNIYIDEEKYHEYSFSSNGFKYFIKLNTVTSIVTKNQLRKDNSLPFYPFDKCMDKYGTIYISIFAQKIEDEVENSKKYDEANDFVKVLLLNMGPDYHFIPQLIKRRIIMAKGL
ncbi:MAG: hypothetical protein IKR19_08080 [Acholeplasmatales bacterium]|nr:hypothetical protein [Acholeplasmatales bacterium]